MGVNLPSFLGEDLTLSANSSLKIMLHRPWSLITHFFTHIQFGHFIFNMIMLYSMGQLFMLQQGSKRLVSLYFLGGLSGYLLFAISYSSFEALHQNQSHYILGASAAVMAIVVATAVLNPKQIISPFGIFRMELIWFAGILVLLDLVSIRDGVNSGGHIGHIGGALLGYFYARQLQKGKDMGNWLNNLGAKIKAIFSRPKMTVSHNSGRPKTDEEFNLEKKYRQKRIDDILDKIARSGYDSLSKDEKDFLFKNSQK
jgi:membrane associated rhomboid family serine protease